jgi:hypothetical protein
MDELIRRMSKSFADAPPAAVTTRGLPTDVSNRMPPRPFAHFLRKVSPSVNPSALSVIAAPLGVLAIAFGAAWLVPGLIGSASQSILHGAAVHLDRSFVRTGVVANFGTPTKLVYRDRNGVRHLILADEIGVHRFINDTLVYLETRRSAIKSNTDRQVDAFIENAFSDGRECISRYADWYFAWGRSWSLLKEGIVGAAKGMGPNNVQGFTEASRNEVESYLVRNFQRLVLKPELRTPAIEYGVAKILAEAHVQYLDTLTELDERLQVYLRTHTHHLEIIDDRDRATVSLDWDAQKWKAPRYSVDDEAFRAAYRGASIIGVTGLIAKTAGTAVERAMAQAFTAAASRIVTSLYPQLLGFAAGSAVEPGAGSLAGWLIGAGGALVIDYAFNWQTERLGRAEFEAASVGALSATKAEYSRAMQRDLAHAVDIWLDDTRAIVVEQQLVRRDGPKS